jgi:RNA polymerase sigma-70 factor (ECF subfamily)
MTSEQSATSGRCKLSPVTQTAGDALPRLRIDRRRLVTSVEEHGDFVARSLRNLGVDDTHLDLAVEKVFLLVLREETSPERLSDPASLFRASARIAAQARKRWPRRTTANETARERLDRVLDKMPEELREVFVLGEIEKRDAAWVAATLGQSTAWAQTRLRRAHRCFLHELTQGEAPRDALPGEAAEDALEVLGAGLSAKASARARERTVRAIEAVSNATLLGRMRYIASRVSLAVWLALGLVLTVVVYELFVSLR